MATQQAARNATEYTNYDVTFSTGSMQLHGEDETMTHAWRVASSIDGISDATWGLAKSMSAALDAAARVEAETYYVARVTFGNVESVVVEIAPATVTP